MQQRRGHFRVHLVINCMMLHVLDAGLGISAHPTTSHISVQSLADQVAQQSSMPQGTTGRRLQQIAAPVVQVPPDAAQLGQLLSQVGAGRPIRFANAVDQPATIRSSDDFDDSMCRSISVQCRCLPDVAQ